MSRLWMIIGSLFTVVVLATAGFGVLNVLAHETETEHFEFDAAGVTQLDVDNDHGSIEIVAAETDTIEVEAEVSHGLRRTEYSAAVQDDALVLRSDCPLAGGFSVWCRVSINVTVPSTLAVDVSSRNGRVTLAGLTGDVVVSTNNGPIEATGLTGALSLTTSNGAVRADGISSPTVEARSSNGPIRLSFSEAPDVVDTSTSNGPIEIVVPDDGEAYRLDLHTSLIGSSETAIRTDPDSDRSISARTSNGPITIRYPA